MILYPAIDIREGSAVRLVQGDYDRETTFDADPVDAAARWSEGGAGYLHVVDLDGARDGFPANLDAVERIVARVDCPVQVGGGLRDANGVAAVFSAGASRAVIGTAAIRDPDFLDAMLAEHGQKIVVAVDARGGNVSLAGWTEDSGQGVEQAVFELTRRGVRHFLFTPIEVDGTLEGPNIDAVRLVAQATGDAEVLYSGGVGSLDDLKLLAATAPANVTGAIVGRALFEGRFTVAEGQAALAR